MNSQTLNAVNNVNTRHDFSLSSPGGMVLRGKWRYGSSHDFRLVENLHTRGLVSELGGTVLVDDTNTIAN